jgi:hypothetical protein
MTSFLHLLPSRFTNNSWHLRQLSSLFLRLAYMIREDLYAKKHTYQERKFLKREYSYFRINTHQ